MRIASAYIPCSYLAGVVMLVTDNDPPRQIGLVKGEHPKAHRADFSGILHADGYAGFRELYEPTKPDKPAAIQEAA
ncbi:hypothetical protein FHT70_003259 [Rhizobium sp. BK049]|uniref:hypothetical protein n=1 Tax=Rhizobium TaxID=379 RepID=UPI0018278773|nr:hypothetical protein [Rhizobium lentis]MBB3353313.1 hypothetical protein [Rhizobium sp. BK049]